MSETSAPKVYSVRACRWGDSESHSYVVGVFSDSTLALHAAKTEEEHRGGKYTCEVLEWVLDVGIEGRAVLPVVVKGID